MCLGHLSRSVSLLQDGRANIWTLRVFGELTFLSSDPLFHRVHAGLATCSGPGLRVKTICSADTNGFTVLPLNPE